MDEIEQPEVSSSVRRAVSWLAPSRAQAAALVGALFAIIGYLSIWGLADELDVAVADFAFDRSAYVLFIGFYVTLGLMWVGVIALTARLVADIFGRSASARLIMILGLVFFATAVVLWFVARELSGYAGLVVSVLLMVSTGAWCGAVASWPGESLMGRWVVGGIAALALVFVVVALNGISLEGREVASYARALAVGETPAEPRSFLGLSVAPSRGWLTVGHESLCVVRVSERVHLLANSDPTQPTQTLIAIGDKFVSDPRCS